MLEDGTLGKTYGIKVWCYSKHIGGKHGKERKNQVIQMSPTLPKKQILGLRAHVSSLHVCLVKFIFPHLFLTISAYTHVKKWSTCVYWVVFQRGAWVI
jgi:hypothetical protein